MSFSPDYSPPATHVDNCQSNPESHMAPAGSYPGPWSPVNAGPSPDRSHAQEYENQSSKPPRKRQRLEISRADVAFNRKRAVAACHQCRARKIKCNNTRPTCGSCLASSSRCEYDDSRDHSSFDPASLLILERITQVLTRLDSIAGAPQSHQEPQDTPISASFQHSTAEVVAPPDAANDGQDSPYDQLRIPSAKASTDSILQWPVFGGQYPANYITDAAYLAEMPPSDDSDVEGDSTTGNPRLPKFKGVGVDEEATMDLVRRFLELVHTKNPILDPETIWGYARRVTEEGFQWDPPSCLVLLACALGCIAEPWNNILMYPNSRTSLEASGKDLAMANRYYNLAQRRLGLLGKGILTPQCHFLAGVYLMYTMRPLSAWSEFQSASKSYHVYLQCQARRPIRASADTETAARRKRLEQRLYWSCYKSECELRSEMNLPNSSLADFHYPDMHPSPPNAPSPAYGTAETGAAHSRRAGDIGPSSDILSHHEQSWFYYLTEITLRRIANRVLNMLYADGQRWDSESMPSMAIIANELEQKLHDWYQDIPAPIRYTEGVVQHDELRYMVYGRVMEIKFCLYRPFLYFAVHNPHDVTTTRLVRRHVEKALDVSMQVVKYVPSVHRHHGTWYGHLSSIAAALSIIAAVMPGKIPVPAGWEESIRTMISTLKYWEDEAPGFTRSIAVLEGFMESVDPR